MASYRGQVVTTYCKSCKCDQEMKPQRDGFDGKIVWLKCQACSDMLFIKKEDFEHLLNGHEYRKVDAEEDYIDYEPHKSFQIGQRVYHPIWDDKGEVLKKEVTGSGRNSIIVAFNRLGEKTLIENLPV